MNRNHVAFGMAALLGILVVWLLMSQSRGEGFVDAGPGPERGLDAKVFEGFAVADPPPSPYNETLANIPLNASLRLYLTSFSAQTNYTVTGPSGNVKESIYSPLGWNDFLTAGKGFVVIATGASGASGAGTPPASIRSDTDIGFNTKNLALKGPSSDYFGNLVDGTTSVALTSFTMAFYGIWNSIDFSTDTSPKVLVNLRAELPNGFEIKISPRTNANGTVSRTAVIVSITLGPATTTFPFNIDVNTLLSNGNPTLYSLVYTKAAAGTTGNIVFRIGRTEFTSTNTAGPIYMGNSQIMINPSGNLDFKLIAFAYYTAPMNAAQLTELNAYFNDEMSGINMALAAFKDYSDALVDELDTLTSLLTKAQTDLETCAAEAEQTAADAPQAKWQIKFDGASTVNADDLAQCKPLHINNPTKTT